MKLKGNHVILSFVLLVFGFLIAFSYQYTESQSKNTEMNQNLEEDYFYRQKLIDTKEKNKKLRQELLDKKTQVHELEKDLAEEEAVIGNFVEEKTKLQMLTGGLPITGSGVEVILKDAEYVPTEASANQYIVHESHVLKVINELLSAGAMAISINGQRIYHDSYIACVGPVISIDGKAHPAPFVITAIGDPTSLFDSLNLKHGIIDELVAENVTVSIQKIQNILMDARLTNG